MAKIKLKDIYINGGTQPREDIDIETVADYAEAMKEGDQFPPVVVFNDGAKYWLADGFHRYHASNAIDYLEIEAEVKNGTKRDAILYSVSANAKHGLRRTNADKRKAVLTLLNDEEWSQNPQTKIAEMCNVSQQFVSKLTREYDDLSYNNGKIKKVKRGDQEYTVDTSNIGKRNIFGKKITEEDLVYDLDDAERGKRYIEMKKPEGFREATAFLGLMKRLNEFFEQTKPGTVLNGLAPKETQAMLKKIEIIKPWLKEFLENVKQAGAIHEGK